MTFWAFFLASLGDLETLRGSGDVCGRTWRSLWASLGSLLEVFGLLWGAFGGLWASFGALLGVSGPPWATLGGQGAPGSEAPPKESHFGKVVWPHFGSVWGAKSPLWSLGWRFVGPRLPKNTQNEVFIFIQGFVAKMARRRSGCEGL